MTANSQFHLPDSDLSQAVFSALSHAASQIIWPYFGQLDADMVRTKSSDTDFVTIADTRAEQYLSSSLLPLIEGADIIGGKHLPDRRNPENLIRWLYMGC